MKMASTLFSTMFAGSTTPEAAPASQPASGGTAGSDAQRANSTLSDAMTAVSGIGTAFVALGQIQAGRARAEEFKAQAREMKLAAREEQTKGIQDAAQLNKDVRTTLQRQQVAFAAAGVDLGSQAVEAAESEAIADMEKEASRSFYEATRATQSRLRAAHNLRLRAKMAVAEGQMEALGSVVKFASNVATRYG